MKKIILMALISVLLGCAAAGVPYTNDPMEKLEYAYQLMNTEGRGLAAEKLGKEALLDFENNANVYGVAEAHSFLGSYYKSQAYRYHKDFYIAHNEYDPTTEKSIQHFQRAKSAFEKDGDYWGVSKVVFGAGNSYASIGQIDKACKAYKESLEIYRSDKNVFKGRVHTFNPAFESYEDMILAFIRAKCEPDA